MIVVVDDGSTDRTSELVHRRCSPGGRVRLIEKRVNEGKAMALNDAIPATRGEIVVIVDRVRLDRVGPAPRAPTPSGWPRSAPRALFGRRDATTHWRTDRVPVEHETVALDAAA